MTNGHYLAYYELHQIPWEVSAPVRFRDSDSGILYELGSGPYHIPRLASPTVTVRAGGALIETVNENYILEGGTYFGVAVPVRLRQETAGGAFEPSFDRLMQISDDAARAVGLCLDQRIPLKRVASYLREDHGGGKRGRMLAMWQAWSGARASISPKTVESVRRGIDHLSQPDVSPRTLLALRWYDQSKAATVGSDRLIALWIALEALMAPVTRHTELVRKTAVHISGQEYGLALTPDEVRLALGLDKILEHRNKIAHEGVWLDPWPVTVADPEQRDWPQILCDVVGEVLRVRLGAAPTGVLTEHVEDGLTMGRGQEPE